MARASEVARGGSRRSPAATYRCDPVSFYRISAHWQYHPSPSASTAASSPYKMGASPGSEHDLRPHSSEQVPVVAPPTPHIIEAGASSPFSHFDKDSSNPSASSFCSRHHTLAPASSTLAARLDRLGPPRSFRPHSP